MRNMAVLHSPAFSYPLPVLVRVLFNLLIFKGKILYYNKYKKILLETYTLLTLFNPLQTKVFYAVIPSRQGNKLYITSEKKFPFWKIFSYSYFSYFTNIQIISFSFWKTSPIVNNFSKFYLANQKNISSFAAVMI